MRSCFFCNLLLLATGIWLCAAGADIHAEGKQKSLTAPERQELDASIYRLFRHVINQGADRYNSGDTVGCYRLYENALLTVRPLINHRPELQSAIDSSLAAAAREPQQNERAFILRGAIDKLRAAVKPDLPIARPADPVPQPPKPKQDEPKKPEPKQPAPKPAEPRKSEPKQPAPKPADPKKPEPMQPAPKPAEPKKPENNKKAIEKKVEKKAG